MADILECSDCHWFGDPLEAVLDGDDVTAERCPKCGSFDTWRHPTPSGNAKKEGGADE